MDKKLARISQLEFFEHVLKNITSNPEKYDKVPSNYPVKDAVKIFLFWMVNKGSLADFNALLGVPATVIGRLIDWVLKAVSVFK